MSSILINFSALLFRLSIVQMLKGSKETDGDNFVRYFYTW